MTNWQTNIFHSCSSSVLFFFFLDNPHNNLSGECMTTQCSPLLSVDSVQRTGGYQRSNTPHSLKKCVEYTTESCQNNTKGQNTDLITFYCMPRMCTTPSNNKYPHLLHLHVPEKSSFVKVCQWIDLCTSSILPGEQPGHP